jgi:GDP-4-dehydro-6-deoxy-D-mannose reductase
MGRRAGRKRVGDSPDLVARLAVRFLITGMGGFAGRYLAALLLDRGHDVHGTVHRPVTGGFLAGTARLDEDHVHVADVTDARAVDRLVEHVAPEGIFHLAGVSFVPDSHADPTAVLRVNVLGSVHVFAAVRRHRPVCRILSVGSADAYGLVDPASLPLTETCAFRPLSPYGASKAAMDLLAFQWARGYGLDIVRVRPFNHTGPGQRADFVCPDFARQVVEIERGLRPPLIETGNLDVVRDFSDVRDVVEAYAALWERGASGEAYNIASGVGRSIREVLDLLLELAGLRAEVRCAPERTRASDVPVVVGSAEKLQTATGWSPRREWRRTLADLLDDRRRTRDS